MTNEHCEVAYEGPHNLNWLRARQSGIGASDAPGLLGLAGNWSSAFSIFVDHLQEPEDNTGEEWLRWGHLLEPVILAEFGARTGRIVKPDGRLLRSKRWPWLTCTLDGWQIVGDVTEGVVEVKNYRFEPDGMPEKLWAQIQAQLAVTGLDSGSYAVLCSGQELKHGDVERDQEWIDTVWVPRSKALWDRIQAGGPAPPPTEDKATAEAVKRWFPCDDGSSVNLGGELLEKTLERESLKLEIAKLTKACAGIDTVVKAAIGDASVGVLPDGRAYTWKANVKGVRTLRAPKVEGE